jgi:Fic family protein
MAQQRYIWQRPKWPAIQFEQAALAAPLASARREQGKVLGLFRALGLPAEAEVVRDIWIEEAVATAAIEGETLDLEAVRSSVMRRLGLEDTRGRVSRSVDGLLDVMQDAMNAYRTKLDDDRVARWQSALFPGGTSSLRRIAVGRYRDHEDPVQIVSGPAGREKVHYEAPPSAAVSKEMRRFLKWWDDSRPGGRAPVDGITRAGIAHLWFETIHPFEDGNGRVGRALVDMALAQDVDSPRRLYSMSSQLMAQRKAYYDALNAAQRGPLDVTPWLLFFIGQFRLACVMSQQVIGTAIDKNRFWAAHAQHDINERQRKVVKRLLDAGIAGFEGGMSAEKYGHLTGASKATATRDLVQLQKLGLLVTTGQGRATRYWVNLPGWASTPSPP